MGEHTKILWTKSTANLWWGCQEISSGCDECYARVFATRIGKGDAWEGVRYACAGIWKQVQKWQAIAAKAGEFHEVFCGSMMDIFEKPLPAVDWKGNPLGITTGDIRDRFFRETVPACPNLLFQLLTKRPGNVRKMVPQTWLKPGHWPPNVITGTSVVDQETADTLIPQLLKVPGRLFLSMEPLLGPVDLTHLDNGGGEMFDALRATVTTHGGHSFVASDVRPIDWIITGGESGAKARRCELEWIRSIVRQCQEAGVKAFVKQLGSRATDPVNGIAGKRLKVHPDAAGLISVRLKDDHGGDWMEWPEDLRVRQMPVALARKDDALQC